MLRKIAFSPRMLFLLVLLLAATAFAQTTAKILGSVSDASGAAIVGAKVIVNASERGVDGRWLRLTLSGKSFRAKCAIVGHGDDYPAGRMRGFLRNAKWTQP